LRNTTFRVAQNNTQKEGLEGKTGIVNTFQTVPGAPLLPETVVSDPKEMELICCRQKSWFIM
jgi:hypothetical protein